MTDAWDETRFTARQVLKLAECLSQMVQLHGDYVSADRFPFSVSSGDPSFHFYGKCLDLEDGGLEMDFIGSVGLSEDGKPYVELSAFAAETDKLYQMIGWCKYHGIELRTNFDMVKAA